MYILLYHTAVSGTSLSLAHLHPHRGENDFSCWNSQSRKVGDDLPQPSSFLLPAGRVSVWTPPHHHHQTHTSHESLFLATQREDAVVSPPPRRAGGVPRALLSHGQVPDARLDLNLTNTKHATCCLFRHCVAHTYMEAWFVIFSETPFQLVVLYFYLLNLKP